MRQPVEEDIIFAVDVLDASVSRSRHVEALFFRPSVITDITVRDDGAAEDKVPVRELARGIAQLVILP